MIIGCLSINEKNIDIKQQQSIIEQYAQHRNLVIDIFMADDIRNLTDKLQTSGHLLLLANITALGCSLKRIINNIQFLIDKKLTITSIAEDITIKPNQESQWLLKGMRLFSDLRSSMVSTVTKKALDNKKRQGFKLGRDFGSKNKKYVWSGKEELIKQQLLHGIPYKEIALTTGMSVPSLYNFLKRNPDIKNNPRGKDA